MGPSQYPTFVRVHGYLYLFLEKINFDTPWVPCREIFFVQNAILKIHSSYIDYVPISPTYIHTHTHTHKHTHTRNNDIMMFVI